MKEYEKSMENYLSEPSAMKSGSVIILLQESKESRPISSILCTLPNIPTRFKSI